MPADIGNTVVAVLVGLGLSAACGFRVFAPLLVVSIAGRAGYVPMASGWDWVAGTPALVALSTATALEIGAYYIPWLDNTLDALTVPMAILAGTFITATCLGDVSPLFKWSLAIIAGGGVAGVVGTATTAVRAASTATTGGLANPLVSTAETGVSVGLAILVIAAPVVAGAVVVTVLFLSVRFIARRLRRRRQEAPAGA